MALDYWYDGQLRRYFTQFVRIFSGFQYQTGVGRDGTTSFRSVPAKYASQDRQVGHIIRNNSENTILTCPQISCWMTSMDIPPERRQAPNHVSNVQVWERAIDPETNKYTNEPGRSYTVERYMAIPYDLSMQVDIWTSNESQKHQILEQILILFNPSIDLQTGNNPIDWTSLGIVSLESISWSSRSIPIGTDSDIDVATLTFKMPIWLSPPAKVKRQNIINQIITNIGQLDVIDKEKINAEGLHWSDSDLLTRVIVTPGGHRIGVEGNELILLSSSGIENNLKWSDLLNQYGKFRPGISQVRLKTTANIEDSASDIIGVLDLHPTEMDKLLWTIDAESLPSNSLDPIHGVIDPMKHIPGTNLPDAVAGQRYMLINDVGPNGQIWGNLSADINDIIQYNGNTWEVVFDSSITTDQHYVLNLKSTKQLKWTGEFWQMSVDGQYNPGFWRLFL